MSGEQSKNIDKEVLWGGGRSPLSMSYGKMMMWFFLISDALTFGGLLTAYGFARHNFTGQWPVADEVFHAFPGLEGHYPLMYVALMTFILIISSVTMVLAVEAGHRRDKSGVIKWLALTVVGGFIFVGSQAWEWAHFIHGSHDGTIILADGSRARLVEIKDYVAEASHEIEVEGHHGESGIIHTEGKTLKIVTDGEYGAHGTVIEDAARVKELVDNRFDVIRGANLQENEYGPQGYADFFFFITGFHGFHVFSGVIINLIILIMVIKGVFEKRGHYEMVEKVGLYWHFVDLVWVFVFTFFYLI